MSKPFYEAAKDSTGQNTSSKPGHEYAAEMNKDSNTEDHPLGNKDLYEKMGDNPDGNKIKEDYQGE
ncbi:hypothetical protein JOC77_003560 [Peribacillus deserti]|uniref:DUF4025 domain-containing protein n=1 Tax=Peribacillus deserti TaxID=673318 RepID=A0ABS2QLR9_9BACI|nr:hypothetical protein [Peribacillus deserti]MBM7694116.1 hypothetical protein [Peribacillus deserti]